jgi:hypothetical protein
MNVDCLERRVTSSATKDIFKNKSSKGRLISTVCKFNFSNIVSQWYPTCLKNYYGKGLPIFFVSAKFIAASNLTQFQAIEAQLYPV